MKKLGYLYLHAPDPENPEQYVTHRITVEIDEDALEDPSDEEGKADDE